MQRYSFGSRGVPSPFVGREVLGRRLELNHQRYAGEVAAGLQEKGKARARVEAEVEEGREKPQTRREKTVKDDGGALKLV